MDFFCWFFLTPEIDLKFEVDCREECKFDKTGRIFKEQFIHVYLCNSILSFKNIKTTIYSQLFFHRKILASAHDQCHLDFVQLLQFCSFCDGIKTTGNSHPGTTSISNKWHAHYADQPTMTPSFLEQFFQSTDLFQNRATSILQCKSSFNRWLKFNIQIHCFSFQGKDLQFYTDS